MNLLPGLNSFNFESFSNKPAHIESINILYMDIKDLLFSSDAVAVAASFFSFFLRSHHFIHWLFQFLLFLLARPSRSISYTLNL